MIRTATSAPDEAMLKAPALLASASQVMPSQVRRAQMRARISGWCSPIPPVNTKASIPPRSEEHTSELQSLMRISYAVFCLKKKKQQHHHNQSLQNHRHNIT